MIFTAKKKKNTHVIIQVQAFRRKPKRLRLLSHKNAEAMARRPKGFIKLMLIKPNENI